jgi:hypothetical protein
LIPLTAVEIDADPTIFLRDRKPVDERQIARRLASKHGRRVSRLRELRRFTALSPRPRF